MSIYGWYTGNGPTGYGFDSTAEQVTAGLDLSGKTFVVTGSNSGIGEETVRVLVQRGARVIATARTVDKVPKGERIVPVALELSEPASVRAAVAAVRTVLDGAAGGASLAAIVANAGVMALPTRQLLHGYEAQWFTNHVGHFLFVVPLLDRLAKDGRIVMVASEAHRRAWPEGVRLDDLAAAREYDPWSAYGQSKLSNILFARHLATRLPAGQTANAVHPGVIATNLVRHMNPVARVAWQTLGPYAGKTIAKGAATQTYVAAHPAAAAITGEYWSDCNLKRSTAKGQDMTLAAALWEKTEQIVATLP